ncbi:hypothetical protein K435DRAFT_821727 [Dendrothele bispora CBS 962.96]|uniref:Helitron helicase-like domain-containing protein n=1 Tax=Dendrothele bispora (strain CBS 962.96) TaxID=1314807 RepID=A0A4S8LGP9_DENBC|nr:hypothetical protein K435DRAFT_821727 [Dendrothele bispora CBS 962.96]
MLLWIKSSKSPQEIRDAILNPHSDFQQKIVKYLESVHTGDFLTGSRAEVENMLQHKGNMEGYESPLNTLPTAPPKVHCSCNEIDCQRWCLDNKWGTCKARFPREVFDATQIDIDTGALCLKKSEPWINTYNSVMTYLLRCNSDVTSLLSGTAIKAVVAYVSDYITKWSLNTHVIFDVIQTILTRNTELINGSGTRQDKSEWNLVLQ